DHGIAAPVKPEHMHIHLPPPSYFPLVLAMGMALVGVGLLSHLAVAVVGAVVLIYGVWGWALEPTE
ncbi:MAG: cytochrome c oxidase subunit 4, partial [Dehalococcoidia bacterium]